MAKTQPDCISIKLVGQCGLMTDEPYGLILFFSGSNMPTLQSKNKNYIFLNQRPRIKLIGAQRVAASSKFLKI